MKIHSLALIVVLTAVAQAHAEYAYTVTDLGTLGGSSSTASAINGHAQNAAGMIVGSSTASDNTEARLSFRERPDVRSEHVVRSGGERF